MALCGHEGPSEREAGGSESETEAGEDGSRGCRDAWEPRGVGISRNCNEDQIPPPQSLPKERGPADVLILTSGLRNRKRTKGGRRPCACWLRQRRETNAVTRGRVALTGPRPGLVYVPLSAKSFGPGNAMRK